MSFFPTDAGGFDLGGIIRTGIDFASDFFGSKQRTKELKAQRRLLEAARSGGGVLGVPPGLASRAPVSGASLSPGNMALPVNFMPSQTPLGFNPAAVLGAITGGAAGVQSAREERTMAGVLPGGAPAPRTGFRGAVGAAFGGDVCLGAAPMRMGGTGARVASTLMFINPNTGAPVLFRNMGRPVLWSGDMAACKRVKKAASRVNRAMPRRSSGKR